MKKISVVLIALLVFGSFVLSKTYIVGTSADFPPFEYVDNGKYVGFDMDLIRSIASLEGFQVEIRDMSFDSLIPALKSGIIDIAIAGMTITPERLKVVDFSTPYWSADQDVIVKKDSNYNLTVLFGNHKIGVQTGTTGDLWVSDNLVKTNILKSIVRYESFIYALQALLNGEVDAVVLDSPVAERFAQTQPVSIVGIIITNENYGIAVNKGNSDLLSKINDGLSKLRSSGQLTILVDKYFGK
ncbi:basic amino acid ABC transporter substrate-binding protein [Athalassotoga saccharophila]|uniref:basic amino acid ABC transporter substrate-binding protein n=1 Tax=Athalassotoga saccharophila TaxID=1441386 RepID=UPI00137A77FB|nr:basic amino acid ABC transporter substrate-binding protein [Athalassotoga saccharophila]BBJ28165.1 amino acid ABC transporter, substrate-binding protein [Athalassotoga saccharophila]